MRKIHENYLFEFSGRSLDERKATGTQSLTKIYFSWKRHALDANICKVQKERCEDTVRMPRQGTRGELGEEELGEELGKEELNGIRYTDWEKYTFFAEFHE